MADSQLEIKIRALVEGIQQVSQLATQLTNTTQAANKAGGSARGATEGLNGLGNAASTSADGLGDMVANVTPAGAIFSELDARIGALVKGFIALAGVMTLKEAADTAARTETLGVTLGIVGANAGYSADQLARYEAELKKLGITTGAAREALTQLIQAGIELSTVNEEGASTAGRLARAAQDLAVVTGENSSDTLTRLILNIRQMDTMGLRYLGLTVNVEAAQERFAASIGKSAAALSQQQKQQAVMNAAMEEASKLAGSYEASLGTVGKQLSSMSRYQEEAANSVGNLLLPAYAELVKNATELLKNMAAIADELEKTSNFSETFGTGLGDAAEALTQVLTDLMQLVANLAPAFGLVVQAAGELVGSLGEIASALIVATDETTLLALILESVALLVAGLADGITLIGAGVSLITAGWLQFLSLMTTGLSQIVGIMDKDMGKALDDVAQKMYNMGVGSQQNFDRIINDFANGETATMRLAKAMEDTDDVLAEFGKASNFDEVTEQIRKLTEAQRTQTMNSVEAVEAGNKIRLNLALLGAQGELTGTEMTKLTVKLANSLSGIEKAYGDTIQALGVGLTKVGTESLFVAMNKETQELAGRLTELAELAPTTGDQFSQAFSKGLESAKSINELELLSKSLDSANMRLFETGNSMSEVRIKLGEMFSAGLGAARTQADIAVLEESLQQLANRGVLTEQELRGLFSRTAERSRELQNELNNSDLVGPLKALGLSLDELGTGLTEMGKKGAQALQEIVDGMVRAGDASRLTGAQFSELFNKSLSTAKTVGDLQLFTKELERAKSEGTIFGQTYKDALTEVSGKFNELFQAQLKAANTRAEFDALKAAVQQVGAAGGITGTQMNLALDQINEKATNAKASMLELAKQSTELATQQASAARASTAVAQANAALEREQRTLAELTKRAKAEGTKESKALLEVQQKIVRQAEAEKRLVELRYRFELAQMDALIAKQKQLNAEKAVALNPGDEGAQAAADLAAKEAERRALVAEQIKKAVASQEALVSSTEKAVIKAKELAEAMGATSEASKEASGNLGGSAAQVSQVMGRVMVWDYKSIVNTLTQAGFTLEQAAKQAYALMGSADAVAAFGTEGIARFNKITEGINNAIKKEAEMREKAGEITTEFQKQADQAQLIADGVITAAQATELFKKNATAVQDAMAQIKVQAYQVAKAAKDSADAFAGSYRSLQEELLEAQGKEDEAAKMRFDNRRRELDLEYQMLQAKIQAAIATGKAAGISTTDLEATLASTKKTYADSLAIINQLEGLDTKKRKEEKAKEKEAEDKARKEEGAKQKALEDQGREKQRQATQESEAAEKLSEQRIEDIREQGAVQEEVIQGSLEAQLKALNSANPNSEFAQRLLAGLTDNSAASASVQSIAKNATAEPALNSVDVSRVILEIGGKTQEVFTRPGEKDGLLEMLAEISTRS